MDNYTNKRRSNMLTEITKEFLNKKPNDEEMMAFLKEHISALFEDYWATDEQKKALKQKEKEAFKELENKKRNLYNPDNLFKNKKVNEVEKHIKNTNITLVNENWYNKIIRVLKNIFT